jgi:ubiquinone/menaquinone biosynthesis C-methylase UbiE
MLAWLPVSKKTDELREHWDDFAPVFEELIEPTTVRLAHALIPQLRLHAAEALLEVGAGAGAAALAARPWLVPNTRHVVTDLSPVMAERARDKLPPQVEVRAADVEELPFEDGSFDRVMANLTLMLVNDVDRALAEIHRVLRPGGIFACTVWGRAEKSPLFTMPAEAVKRAGVVVEDPERSNFHLGDATKFRERLAGHGFDKAIAWYQPMIPALSSPRACAEFILSTPSRTQMVDGHEELSERVCEELVTLFEEVHARGEPIGLDALVTVARRGV